jgi:kynurenine formamidase
MRASLLTGTMALVCASVLTLGAAAAQTTTGMAGQSPWGPADEIGRLNMMTETSQLAILKRIASGKVYDLSVEYYIGMPSWYLLGDPRYQIWMTHTPQGTVVDNPLGVSKAVNEKVSYSGDAISMYTHTGTHIDTLNHFGLHGKLWNGFTPEAHLGDRGWTKAGAERVPPIVARGVLIDVAAAKGVAILPESYGITPQDLQETLAKQGTTLQAGDVVLLRTGRMQVFYGNDANKYLLQSPGITLEAAQWLIDTKQTMALGADNIGLEAITTTAPDNWVPVHTYLEAERGVTIIEVLDLEALARDKVYEFVFIGAPLKLRGATGSPMRPLAIPVR